MTHIVSPSSQTDVRRLLQSVVGERLSTVRYRYHEVDDGAVYESALPDVDTDLAVVTLEFEEGPELNITWAIEGDVYGLSVTTTLLPETLTAAPETDVSARAGWQGLVGDVVSAVAGAWYHGADVVTLWSLRLDVDDRSAVVATGGVDMNDALVYEPDELVTIFDASKARAFRPQPGDDPAWGSLIAG